MCCGEIIPFDKRNTNSFCNNSCAAKYNNPKKGKRSESSKKKISEIISNKSKKNVKLLDGTVVFISIYEASILYY